MELDSEFRPGMPIWQGDLIGIGDWNNSPPLDKFGVVITADCDIQRARPEQSIVYLRVISQVDFIDVFWSREKLEKSRLQSVVQVSQMINRIRKVATPEAVNLEFAAIERWITASSDDEICDAISVTNGDDRASLSSNIAKLRQLQACCRKQSGVPCLQALAEYTTRSYEALLKQASGELSRMRDDLFYITGLLEPQDSTGYYVLLDQIAAIRIDQIGDSLAEVKRGDKQAYRLGRMGKQFKYAMAQRFALLFQRIGLPNEYAEKHSRSLDSLVKSHSVAKEPMP